MKPDGLKAVKYLNKAAERGDYRSAFHALAKLYRTGKAGLNIDGYKVIEYLTKLDDLRAIAEIYRDGKAGVEPNPQNDGNKALEYFLKADELGDEWAYIDVARIYRYGKGNLKPDGVKLVEFLTQKLERNEDSCGNILYDIAKIYETGCGSLLPDWQKAIEFYRKAAAQGYSFAKERLA